MTALSPAKVTTEKSWTEVISNGQKRKTSLLNTSKIEPEKRRVIFRREVLLSQKSEAELMLALNKLLRKAGILTYTRFSRVGYSQFGAISALLTEKSSVK